jgi:hypothetical protein
LRCYIIGFAVSSYQHRYLISSSSIGYLLERLDTVRAADYAIEQEITRFLQSGCKDDNQRTRVLDYLILRDAVGSRIAQEIRKGYKERVERSP